MDNTTIILTLHPATTDAWTVLNDPRNNDLVINEADKALDFTLDKPPKFGKDFVIGRNDRADVVLTEARCSARHCVISVNEDGVPKLHERSSNGTYINGRYYRHDTLEIKNDMYIEIRGAGFFFRIPWRGDSQKEYVYKVKRARESRARTPLDGRGPIRGTVVHTTRVERLGPYELTDIIDELPPKRQKLDHAP